MTSSNCLLFSWQVTPWGGGAAGASLDRMQNGAEEDLDKKMGLWEPGWSQSSTTELAVFPVSYFTTRWNKRNLLDLDLDLLIIFINSIGLNNKSATNATKRRLARKSAFMPLGFGHRSSALPSDKGKGAQSRCILGQAP